MASFRALHSGFLGVLDPRENRLFEPTVRSGSGTVVTAALIVPFAEMANARRADQPFARDTSKCHSRCAQDQKPTIILIPIISAPALPRPCALNCMCRANSPPHLSYPTDPF